MYTPFLTDLVDELDKLIANVRAAHGEGTSFVLPIHVEQSSSEPSYRNAVVTISAHDVTLRWEEDGVRHSCHFPSEDAQVALSMGALGAFAYLGDNIAELNAKYPSKRS